MVAAADRDVAGQECDHARTPRAARSGAAGKKQVQRMVGALLGLPEPPRSDHTADALAVAICHANGAPLSAALAG